VTYLVSATDEIRHPGSLIARFLRAEFPVLAGLASDFEQQIHGASVFAPSTAGSDYPWSLVGTAIDYRLRFLFEILPVTRLQAFQAVQGWHISDAGTALDELVTFPMGPNSRRNVSMAKVSADLFSELRDFLRRVRPARRYLARDDEAWLCRYCAALALIDTKLVGKLRIVIVCSAASRELDEKQAILTELGISTLEKPFDIDVLYNCVRAALARAREYVGSTA
jgi:hypothetical protein